MSEKGLLLGIASYDVPYMVNDDGTIVSFVQANELWNYNQEKDELSLLFQFYGCGEYGCQKYDGYCMRLRFLRLREMEIQPLPCMDI